MEVLAGIVKDVGHSSRDAGMDSATGEAVEDHGVGLLKVAGVAQRVDDTGAEAGAGTGGPGVVELPVVVAVDAGGERGRLASATVGFEVAAEGIVGEAGGHGVCPFVRVKMRRPHLEARPSLLHAYNLIVAGWT